MHLRFCPSATAESQLADQVILIHYMTLSQSIHDLKITTRAAKRIATRKYENDTEMGGSRCWACPLGHGLPIILVGI